MGKMARERYENRRTSTTTSSSGSSYGSPRPSVALSRMSSLNEDDSDLAAKLKLINQVTNTPEHSTKTNEEDRQEPKKKIHDKNVRYSDEIFVPNEPADVIKDSSVKLKSIMKTNSKEYEQINKINEEANEVHEDTNGTSSDTSHDTVIASDSHNVKDKQNDIVQNGDSDQTIYENGISKSSEINSIQDIQKDKVQNELRKTKNDVSGIKIVGSIDKLRTELNTNNHKNYKVSNVTNGFKSEKTFNKNSSLDKMMSLQDIRGRIRSDRSDSGFSESSVGKIDHVSIEPKTSKVQALSSKFKPKESNQTTKQPIEVNKLKSKHSKVTDTEKDQKSKVNSLSTKTELFESLKINPEDKSKKVTQNHVIQSKTELNKKNDSNSSIVKNQKVEQVSKTSSVRDQSPSRLSTKLKQFQSNVKSNSAELKRNNKNNVIVKNKVQENPFIKQQNLSENKPLLSKLKTQTTQDNIRNRTPPGSPTTKSDSSNKFFNSRKTTLQNSKPNSSPQSSKLNISTDDNKLTTVDKLKSNNVHHIDTSTTTTSRNINEKREHTSKTTLDMTKITEKKSSSIFNRVHSKISNDLLSKFEQSQKSTEKKSSQATTGSQSKEMKSQPILTKTAEETVKDIHRLPQECKRECSLTRVSNTHVSTNSVESKLITNSVFHTKQVLNNNNAELINNNVSSLDETIKAKSSATQGRGLVEEKFKLKQTFGSKESARPTTDVHGSSFQKAVAFWKR